MGQSRDWRRTARDNPAKPRDRAAFFSRVRFRGRNHRFRSSWVGRRMQRRQWKQQDWGHTRTGARVEPGPRCTPRSHDRVPLTLRRWDAPSPRGGVSPTPGVRLPAIDLRSELPLHRGTLVVESTQQCEVATNSTTNASPVGSPSKRERSGCRAPDYSAFLSEGSGRHAERGGNARFHSRRVSKPRSSPVGT